MSLIYSTVIGTLLNLKRTCPQCGRNQIVPLEKKKEAVPCKFCKITIPPPKQLTK